MEFREEVEALSNISLKLLQKLESEHVKRYIKEVCNRVQKEGWLEKEGDKPWVKTFERGNYILKIGFIHARRGERITGTDLVFELKDKKVVFIQSKRVSSNGRIYFNRFQLQKLMELEWQIYASSPYSTVNFHEWIEIIHHLFHILRNKYEPPFFNPILPFYYFTLFYPVKSRFIIYTSPPVQVDRFY